jgi:hypothetical protein
MNVDLSKVNWPQAGLLVAGIGVLVWIVRSNELSKKDRKAFGKAMLATGATAGAWWAAQRYGYLDEGKRYLSPKGGK